MELNTGIGQCWCNRIAGHECGRFTRRRFAPGHDARFKAILQKAYRNGQKVEFFFNGEGADGHVGYLLEEADQIAILVAPKMLQFVIYEAKRPQVAAETARPAERDFMCDACGEGDHDHCEWERWVEEEQVMYTCGCGTGHD